MARFRNKKKKGFVKPVVKKQQPNVDHITGDKIPRNFVFSRGKLPGPLRQLEKGLRKLMLPCTALKLKDLLVTRKSGKIGMMLTAARKMVRTRKISNCKN